MLKSIAKSVQNSLCELFVPPKKQIPALDGVRTIAILLVVGLHTNLHLTWSGLGKPMLGGILPFQGGWVGVPLFFVLSGFFIGTQLWREFNKTNSIQVLKFILRRGLRIWPLYYFICAAIYFIFPERCTDTWTNLFFVANYFSDTGPIRGAWSLSTEEQFYIFIPTLIFICARYFNFGTLKAYRRMLVIILLSPMLIRAITWYYLTGFDFFDVTLYRMKIYRPFHTHFDGLIVGLLISNILSDKSFTLPSILKKPWILLLSTATIMITLAAWQKVIFNYAALAWIFGCFVWMTLNTNNLITKILSLPIFYWTAKVSFGVYLIHHPVLWLMEDMGWFKILIINPDVHLLITYGLTFLIACIISSLTYILIESPFIKKRNKWLS